MYKKSGKPGKFGKNRIPDNFCLGKNYHQKNSYHLYTSKIVLTPFSEVDFLKVRLYNNT